MRLSKSRFTTGLQCYRRLWWQVHEPEALELRADAMQQAIFDQGSRVGRLARARVPGGVLIDFPPEAIAERVAATTHAIASDTPAIYEASFIAGDTFAAVDILERIAGGWSLIEVKSGTRPRAEYLPDIAVQLHVLRKSGLAVPRAELMHLNRACTYPDLADLFTRVDVTPWVEPRLPDLPLELGRQLAMLQGPLPAVPIGRHCEEPYPCPFKPRCWPTLPEHHISTLYYLGSRWWDLAAQGFHTIRDLPDDFPLQPAAAARQRRAVVSGATVVEPSLSDALAALEHPLAIVDFETIGPAIPLWNGCHPYDPVPVQMSCHAEDGRGGWTHSEWIADSPEDPRPELVRRLAAACAGASTILAYHAEYERQCLKLIAESRPELRAQIDGILARLADALPLVRDHVYHLGFHGSFSLKSVLPALVPELGYDGLEIQGGWTASRELERLLLDGDALSAEERRRVREALLRYCELDTWGVVRMLERLEDLARGATPAS